MRTVTKTKQPLEQKRLDLDALIRAETVLSRLPIHNLERGIEEDFRIMIRRRKNEQRIEDEKTQSGVTKDKQNNKLRDYHFYWKASQNAHYGWPSKLSYDFETLFLAKLFDDIGRPLPRLIRIGPLTTVNTALGRDAKTTKHTKTAMLQSASVFIDFRMDVRGLDDKTRPVEGHGTRFNIIMRGEQLPDGSKADTYYLSLNDPFLQIYNNAKVAPRDYKYLAQLKPLQRRFYELIQPQLWGINTRGEHHLDVDYSWYCMHAPVRRHKDRKLMQTQMGRIQRPHIKAGYIDRVEYIPTTDHEGKTWIIRYYPGKAAKEEHRVFNGLSVPDRYKTGRKTRPRVVTQKSVIKLAERKIEPNTEHSGQSGSPLLARYFELVPTARATRKDDDKLQELIEKHCAGSERKAKHVIEYFARRVIDLGWTDVQTFRALFSSDARYVKEALEHLHEEDQQADQRKQELDREVKQLEERSAYEKWVAGKLKSIKATDEYQQRLAERLEHWRREKPTWSTDTAETTARQEVYHQLTRKGPLTRERWIQSQQPE